MPLFLSVPCVLSAALLASAPAAQQGFVQCTRVLHTLEGEAAGDLFGWVSAPLPDLDGDGAQELVVGAPGHSSVGSGRGRVYVYSGRSGLELFRADGDADGVGLGQSMRALPDLDGDGIAELVAGGLGTPTTRGAVYVYSGASGGLLRTLRLGAPGDGFGYAVDGLDDLDGDGLPEIAVGAPAQSSAGAGAGRVVVLSGADGSLLRSFLGADAGDLFGSAVARLGDVNGDGVNELVVGAPAAGASANGLVYVYDLVTGTPLYAPLVPDASANQFGQYFAADVGDTDGDGWPDLYVGDYADGAAARGKAYLFAGPSGARLLTLTGQNGAGFGIGRGLGDVNGDGRADLVLGSYTFGGGATLAGKLEVFSGADGTLLRRVTSTTPRENLGFDAHGLGDVDGDGVVELVGTAATFAQQRGRVYVIAAHPARSIGTGLAGSGGSVPALALSGCPRLGAALSLEVSGALGGAPGVLVVGRTRGDLALLGGTLYPSPGGFQLVHVAGGTSGDPGAGTFSLPVQLGLDPVLIGARFHVQALYLDPQAPRGASFTQGLTITTF